MLYVYLLKTLHFYVGGAVIYDHEISLNLIKINKYNTIT